MPQNHLELGNWNALCDVCGMKFKATELRKDWRGLMVCSNDFELRHPQDFLRVRGDDPAVPWTRPDSELYTGPACFLWDQSSYADLGTTDCMQVDYTPLPYTQLWSMKYPIPWYQDPYYYTTAIPGYALPGYAEPSETIEGLI